MAVEAMKKIEDGLGKLLLDYKMDFINFSYENHKWLLNKNSKEYTICRLL